MKKIVSIVLLISFLMSSGPFVFAADNFQVSYTAIKNSDDLKTIDMLIPIFEGFKGAEEVNKRVLNIALDAIGDANSTAKSMEALKNELLEKGETPPSMVVRLDMTYDYVKLGEILSLQLNIYSYSGGAHGSSQIISITTNTSTGEVYELKDLFKENVDYNQVITGMILKEIKKDPETYFPDYEETIRNKDGMIYIYCSFIAVYILSVIVNRTSFLAILYGIVDFILKNLLNFFRVY